MQSSITHRRIQEHPCTSMPVSRSHLTCTPVVHSPAGTTPANARVQPSPAIFSLMGQDRATQPLLMPAAVARRNMGASGLNPADLIVGGAARRPDARFSGTDAPAPLPFQKFFESADPGQA